MDIYDEAIDILDDEFDEYREYIIMENDDSINFQKKYLREKTERQVNELRARIERLRFEGKTRTIPANEGKIKKLLQRQDDMLSVMEKNRVVEVDWSTVLAGVINVT